MMPTPTQIHAYSWIIGKQTDGAGQGTLYAGHNRLPLPILDSRPRLQQRIAFAMLLHAFEGEEHAERSLVEPPKTVIKPTAVIPHSLPLRSGDICQRDNPRKDVNQLGSPIPSNQLRLHLRRYLLLNLSKGSSQCRRYLVPFSFQGLRDRCTRLNLILHMGKLSP